MPRNKYPEQTVEKILDAAAALFAEKGYQSTGARSSTRCATAGMLSFCRKVV